MLRTLVTGFGPFLEVTENPSSEIAESLNRPCQILDVQYSAVERFLAEVDPQSFDQLMLIGVARRAKALRFELFARNAKGPTPDSGGSSAPGPIDLSSPLLLPASLWANTDVVAKAIQEGPFVASMDAGRYLCNYIAYRALQTFPDKRVGFLHIPHFSEVSKETQVESIASVLTELER